MFYNEVTQKAVQYNVTNVPFNFGKFIQKTQRV